MRQKIRTFLWFDNQAEEAARFYVSLFPESEIQNVVRCGDAGPGPAGSVLTMEFQLAGRQFIALNGGPHFKFNEAISLSVDCESQDEIDDLWGRLTTGGSPSRCGWLKDKYGLSWQIVPRRLGQLLSGPDPEKSMRATEAMLQMSKLDIAALQRAYDGN